MSGENSPAPEGATPSIDLQIVSPSVGVPQPLIFHKLAITTTVAELKERITEAVTLRPPADQQRLIHRGRYLHRNEETLGDIFRTPVRSNWSGVCGYVLTMPNIG